MEKGRRGELYAIVAPSFTGQFGNKVLPEQIFSGIERLGFDRVMEVAYGADCDTLQLSKQFVRGGSTFLGTSCCPSWVLTARSFFPELADNIADSFTPMVETAKKIKEKAGNAKVVFIRPCIAKKYEALTDDVTGYIDHVLTFEELAALFVAFGIDLSLIESDNTVHDASSLGRGYAVAGGVGEAIMKTAKETYGATGLLFERADTLSECREMLERIRSGKSKADLVEGMACPGSCIGGPGTLAPQNLTHRQAHRFADSAEITIPECEEIE